MTLTLDVVHGVEMVLLLTLNCGEAPIAGQSMVKCVIWKVLSKKFLT